MLKALFVAIVAAPAILAASRPASAPTKVQLTLATLHAAALTTARGARDTTDSPFIMVETTGRRAGSMFMIPETGIVSIRHDGAIPLRPLTDLTLAEGDSVEVLVSVLEHATVPTIADLRVANPPAPRAGAAITQFEQATRRVAPLLKDGAHWIGAVSLLLTNEGGSVYWRRLDCVAACKVLSGPATGALPASGGQPFAGLTELTGDGGTYHLALRANRAP